MDRTGLLIGGTFLIIGGVVYYFLIQMAKGNNGNGTNCTDWKNKTDCENAGCYWYNNSCHKDQQTTTSCEQKTTQETCTIPCHWYDGSCHTKPQPCQGLGACNTWLNGWQTCDGYKNLCRCDGTKFNLIEENSTICKDNIKYQMCGVNYLGIVACLSQAGYGTDECDAILTRGEGCSCSRGNCPNDMHCAPDMKCVKIAKAQYLSKVCGGVDYFDGDQNSLGTHWCTKILDKPLCAEQILGGTKIYFEWLALFDQLTYAIDFYYDGAWTRVYEGTHTNIGTTECSVTLESNIDFGGWECIKAISVGVASGVSNAHVKSWNMTLQGTVTG